MSRLDMNQVAGLLETGLCRCNVNDNAQWLSCFHLLKLQLASKKTVHVKPRASLKSS